MSREVIQDFLHLEGIVGIALTNRRMRPYFYGLDAVLDRTKQALGQGVLQVVENVPEGCESFEFNFSGHVVFIYKLTHGLVLLVLTDNELKLVDYNRSITKIKYLIESDTYNTVANFKLLLGSVTQTSLPSTNWNASSPSATAQGAASNPSDSSPSATVQAQPTTGIFSDTNIEANVSPFPSSTIEAGNLTNKTSSTTTSKNVQSQSNVTRVQTPPESSASAPISKTIANSNPTKVNNDSYPKSVSVQTGSQEYKLNELLAALNKLSNFTTQYLGKVVVANYLKSSRPADVSWLLEFEVDRNGQVSHPKQATIICTPEQLQQIHSWVTVYIKRCKQVIRNFDQMLVQDCLDVRQRQILLTSV